MPLLYRYIYTRTPIATDEGVRESIAVEDMLTCNYTMTPSTCTTGFPKFAASHGFDDVPILNNNLGCNCLSNSTAGQEMQKYCWTGAATDVPHSPVRDWWSGDY